jgi:ferredoxin
MPSTTEARPPRCLGCGAASRPHGANLVVHGDGTRDRQVRGPPSATAAPALGIVRVRRFECQQCGACMVVVPRELLPRRLYTACAIGLALAVWALMRATEAETRARVSPLAIVGAIRGGLGAETPRGYPTSGVRRAVTGIGSPSGRAVVARHPGGNLMSPARAITSPRAQATFPENR